MASRTAERSMWASPPGSDSVLLHVIVLACIVMSVIAVEVWVVVFFIRSARLRRARLAAAAEEELTALVLDQLSGYAGSAAKLRSLTPWKRRILLRVLQSLIEQTKGSDQAGLVRILREAGFHASALERLDHGRAPARQTACAVLGFFDDERSIGALHRALADPDAAVRLTAARALLHKDRIDSLRALLRQLPFSPADPPLALAAIFAQLPARLHAEAVELLRARALPSEWLRMLALALARKQVFDAFEAIAALRQAAEPRVRAAAWVALGELGDPRAGDFVAGGLRDPDDDVRQAACHCAGKLGGPAVAPLLLGLAKSGGWWSRYHAAAALIEFGAAGAAALQEQLAGAAADDPARQAWQDAQGGADGR
ncbi:MAG: hypothetical protein C0502_05590 [Opitutus sp.]|nr:hypothetical protein [Opitutus sp.]